MVAVNWDGTGEGVTVSIVVPVLAPDAAVIVVAPTANAVAIPPFAMVAIDVFDEFQATEAVRSFVELSG